MAYGDYGAFVYKNNVRMRDWEDQTPYKEKEIDNGYWQAFLQARDKTLSPHHAVLGDGPKIRLCGYKYMPSLLDEGEAVLLADYYPKKEDLEKYNDTYCLPDEYEFSFEYKNYKVNLSKDEDEPLTLGLMTPEGDVWHAICGYGVGA